MPTKQPRNPHPDHEFRHMSAEESSKHATVDGMLMCASRRKAKAGEMVHDWFVFYYREYQLDHVDWVD
jgi:hypothetical protein